MCQIFPKIVYYYYYYYYKAEPVWASCEWQLPAWSSRPWSGKDSWCVDTAMLWECSLTRVSHSYVARRDQTSHRNCTIPSSSAFNSILLIRFSSTRSILKPGFHYPSWRPELTARELTGDRFQLPVNTGRVDWRAFPLAELMGRVVNSASGNRALDEPMHADFFGGNPNKNSAKEFRCVQLLQCMIGCFTR